METITTDNNKLTAVLSAMVEGVIAVDKNEKNHAYERVGPRHTGYTNG